MEYLLDELEQSSLDGDVSVGGYTAEIMVEMYLEEPIQTRCVDPLNYWKEKELYEMALWI